MSQIHIDTTVQTQQIHPQENVGQPRADLPRELQNARPSTSIWAKIGRVATYIARGIGAVATLGLSEAAIWGIRKLCRFASASEVPASPRVSEGGQLPEAAPQVDTTNSTLYKNMLHLTLPEEYTSALNELLEELRANFGTHTPTNLDQLKEISLGKTFNPFVMALRTKVHNSTTIVTPAILKEMAKNLLLPELTCRSIANALRQEAADLGIEANPEILKRVAVDLFTQGGKVLFNEQTQASDFVASNRDLAKAELQKTSLIHSLESNTLPQTHKAAFDGVLQELRLAYGQDSLPSNLEAILQTKVPSGFKLNAILIKATEKNGPLSPQDFATYVRNNLKPIAQRNALGQALCAELETTHGLKIHPKLANDLVKSLENRMPDLNVQMHQFKGSADATQFAKQQGVQQLLTEIASNIQAMEAEYLPKVSPAVRPILQNFIRSLPFGPEMREQSFNMVETMIPHMAGWKTSLAFGDKGVDNFCQKMVQELNIRTTPLAAEQPNKFDGNIFTSFRSDANRCKWNFNGKQMDYMPAENLIGELTRTVPTAIDQQFLSKLTNQYAWSNMDSPLEGQWNMSGDESAPQVNGSGLATHSRVFNSFFRQSQDFDDVAGRNAFVINVAPDKKSAVVEIIHPQVICTDSQNPIAFGTCVHVMRIECQLSAGDPNVKPSVTNVQMSQELKPLAI